MSVVQLNSDSVVVNCMAVISPACVQSSAVRRGSAAAVAAAEQKRVLHGARLVARVWEY